jgi:hypothetical protein
LTDSPSADAGDDDPGQEKVSETSRRRLGEPVRSRLEELGVPSVARAARESGVSYQTWRRLLAGGQVTNRRSVNAICEYLGWTWDSFERVHRGGAPASMGGTPPRSRGSNPRATLVSG